MTVTSTPASVLPATAEGGSWIVQNTGDNPVYVGRSAAGATYPDGLRLAPGQAVGIDLGTVAGSGIWASTETGTSTVQVLATR